MVADQGDLPKPIEPPSKWKPRMLFHIAGTGSAGVEPIRRIGLLAETPTLTPLIDFADHYAGGDILTFWYPKRGEVDGGRGANVHTPTTKVTPEMKTDMERILDGLGLDSFRYNAIRNVIDRAKTYLPGERLRAFANLKYRESMALLAAMPLVEDDMLEEFASHRGEIATKVEAVLIKMDLTILDPSLTRRQLADDIVRAKFENTLLNLNVGGSDVAGIQRSLKLLQSVAFQEPEYERYRTNITSKLTRKLSEITS